MNKEIEMILKTRWATAADAARNSLLWLPSVVLAWGLCFSGGVSAEDVKVGQFKLAKADSVLRGDAKCTACHDETEKYPVFAIGKTKHGTAADGRTPTCTSCHGASENHMRKLEGQKDRPKPDVTYGGQYQSAPEDALVDRYFGKFGKGTSTPVADRNGACLTCHTGGKRMHWTGSTHANRDVACTNCHQVHTAHDKARDKQTQTELCFSCHKEQRAQVNRPSHHPVLEGKMACSDCHNVHGNNPKQLVGNSVNETCYLCHMEKRGPFVHNHQPVSEDCTICHNAHGTNIANLLKQRPPFLCQDCHASAGHPQQLAALPTARTASTSNLGTVGRGCVNCHTNIHGGNSTVNSATAGRFRR